MRNLFCVLFVSVLALAACGSDPADEKPNKDKVETATTSTCEEGSPQESCEGVFGRMLEVGCEEVEVACEEALEIDCEQLNCFYNYQLSLIANNSDANGDLTVEGVLLFCDLSTSGC